MNHTLLLFDHFELFLNKMHSLCCFGKEEIRIQMSHNNYSSEYSSEEKKSNSSSQMTRAGILIRRSKRGQSYQYLTV